MSLGPHMDPVFWVVRNPRDPNEDLVSWDVLDSRTQSIAASFPIPDPPALSDAQADAITRNQGVS